MAIHKSRYTARFQATANLVSSPVAELEAYASLDKLRTLLPPEIDPSTKPTILFAAGNLMVSSLTNANDDAISLDDTLRIYKSFEWQQVNEEHNRGEVRGFIVKAGLSEFGTNRLITEEEARKAARPVNVAIVIALWKIVDKDLTTWLQQSDAPGSPDKDKLSLSFEVGFDDYDIIALPRDATNLDLITTRITPDSPDWEHYNRLLRCNGGKGSIKDQKIARMLVGNIIPLGAGIVVAPAAAVKGLTTITENPHNTPETETDAGLYKYSSVQCTLSSFDAEPLLAYALSIPDEHIYTDEKDPTLGRELESHTTICYGLTSCDPTPIHMILGNFGPIQMILGKVMAFENDDKPYDVLYVTVDSIDLHRANALIKTSTEVINTKPEYIPHLTIAYVKKGNARGYVGDSRFEGTKLTFNSVSFRPHDGNPVEIPLFELQSAPTEVYTNIDTDMIASRTIKLSAGWQERLASLQPQSLTHGVTITLSDGRKITNAQVIDAQTLEASIDVSLAGVVITDMTPGVPPQTDDQKIEHPHKADIYPTKTEEKVKEEEEEQKRKEKAQHAGYTGASFIPTLQILDSINQSIASVLSNTTMKNFAELKESIASVKTPEDLTTVVANVAQFAEEIAKASEEQSKARKEAEEAKAATETTLAEIKAQLDQLTKTHNDMLAAQAAALAEAKFQERMASINEIFAFDDEIRAEIIEDIKACSDNDEAFSKWLTKAKKTMKGWLKTKASVCEDDKKKKEEDEDEEEAKARKAAAEALASAKNNVVDTPIHNVIEPTKDLQKAYMETFAKNIRVDGQPISNSKS